MMPVWKTELVIRLFTPNFTRFLLNVVDMLYADVFVQDLFSSLYFCNNICLSLSFYLYYLFLPSL